MKKLGCHFNSLVIAEKLEFPPTRFRVFDNKEWVKTTNAGPGEKNNNTEFNKCKLLRFTWTFTWFSRGWSWTTVIQFNVLIKRFLVFSLASCVVLNFLQAFSLLLELKRKVKIEFSLFSDILVSFVAYFWSFVINLRVSDKCRTNVGQIKENK